jgi:hypothetical protein
MTTASATIDALIDRLGSVHTPFTVELPSGEIRKVGDGEPTFTIGLRNERALRAVRSLMRAISPRPISTAISISRAT